MDLGSTPIRLRKSYEHVWVFFFFFLFCSSMHVRNKIVCLSEALHGLVKLEEGVSRNFCATMELLCRALV